MNLSSILQTILIALLVLVLLAFVFLLFFPGAGVQISARLSLHQKSEAFIFTAIGAAGLLLALNALMAHKRSRQLDQVVKAQAEAASEQARAATEQSRASLNAELGRRHERLHNGVEHLGHESVAVRLGGAYELFHLAEDTESLRQPVLDILCSHIRRTTGQDIYRRRHRSNPSEEVQSLLSLLFVSRRGICRGLQIDLQGSWLNGATLCGAYLCGANLAEARLRGADVVGARLQGADLSWAHLQVAGLSWARLQGAELVGARLDAASLSRANLQGADLARSMLRGAGTCPDASPGRVYSGGESAGRGSHGGAVPGRKESRGLPRFFRAAYHAVCRRRDRPERGGFRRRDDAGGGGVHSGWDVPRNGERAERKVDAPRRQEHVLRTSGTMRRGYRNAYTDEEAEKWIAEYEEATTTESEEEG